MRYLNIIMVMALIAFTAFAPRTVAFGFEFVPSAHAQDSSASPAASASPSPVIAASPAQSSMAKVGNGLSDLANKIPLSGVVITVLVGLYDFIRRKWPTKDPASLLRDLKSLFKGIISLLQKLDDFIDSIVGQNSQN